MRKLFIIIFFVITTFAYSKEKSDSTKSPLKVSGEVTLNANGIASVPAFALGKPTITANIKLNKNRFSYDPQLSYSLDFKPWFIDNWFRYQLLETPKFELRTSLNISMFFNEYETPDEVVLRGQRYMAFELAGMYKPSRTSSISLMAWYDNGLDSGTITGYFINLVGDLTDIRLGKHFLMAANLQIFYLNYTDENNGLFISPKISFSISNIPFFVFSQGIQPLISTKNPYPDFQWNIGLGYKF
jgi:hypothetical protein